MKHLLILIASIYTLLACKPANNQNMVTPNQSSVEQVQDQGTNPNIDIATAKKMMSQSKNIVLIDVRTQGEVSKGKIGNALHIDISQPDFNTKIAALDKNKEYIVYCAVGGRSAKALTKMQEMGFKNAHNMMGGYNAWIKN